MPKLLWFTWGFALAVILAVGLILGPLQRLKAGPAVSPTAAPPALPEPSSPAPSAMPTPAPTGLHWQREGRLADAVQWLAIQDLNQVYYVPGSGGPRLAYLTQEERAAYAAAVARYRSCEYVVHEPDGLAGGTVRLRLAGLGALAPSEAEQLGLARWAEGVFKRLADEEQRADLLAQARLHLSGRTGVATDDLAILALEPATWPDACLGIQEAGLYCAQVLTPGYRIQLQAGDALYEYRTDLRGRLRTVPQTGG
ncbi:MAG: hypothetical protein V1772_07755 [Chloroflexota bacterium]